MELKIVISDPKTGKSIQKDLKDGLVLKGKKIGDSFKGELIDFTGYEFKITGGSDSAGFPMRKDVPGTGRKKVLDVSGIGISNKKKYRKRSKKGLRTMNGMRQRKTVSGNTVYAQTAQINLVIVKAGKENLFAEAKPEGETAPAEGGAPKAETKPEEKKEDKKEEAPKEEKAEKTEKKEEPKVEEKKPEEKPAEKKD